MRWQSSALSVILAASMLVLIGCKGDEAVPEVNEPKVQQSEQPKQPASGPEAEEAAIAAAEAWLAFVDSGQYAKSWDEAAQFLRNTLPKERWEPSLGTVRARCGKLVSRELMSKNFTTTLKGAPEGKYVVIQYRTRFEKKSVAVETITPMLDKDGQGGVSGYYGK